MKKFYLFSVMFLSIFLGSNFVSADTLQATGVYTEFDTSISNYLNYTSKFDELFEYYENNYSSSFPYFAVHSSNGMFSLFAYKYNSTCFNNGPLGIKVTSCGFNSAYVSTPNDSYGQMIRLDYSFNSSSISSSSTPYYDVWVYYSNFGGVGSQTSYLPLYTNFSFNPINADISYSNIELPSFTSSVHNITINAFSLSVGDNMPSYLALYNGSYEQDYFANYTEINLNNYSYVALSLKNYSSFDSSYTNIYTKGQLCYTTVYDYGLREKYNPLEGNYAQGCTIIYNNFTPVQFYVLQSDLENHAIYYFKAYDTNIPNVIRVDNNIFDITYISSDDEDNPMIYANGRYYSAIPYDDLSSTATLSEEQGRVSGVVCNLGDTECYYKNTGIDISNLFTQPLVLLQSVWSSIVTVFTLITSFIILLPPMLQAFLISAFCLAIVLGILKIILG